MSMLNDKDVFILCGGLGKRLKSEIADRPKVLADIDGQPFLAILLKYLRRQGFRRVVLGTGYMSDQIEEFCRNNDMDLEIEFSKEQEPLGTGGAVKYASPCIKSDVFFALNGDCFCPIDFLQLLEFHTKHNARATLVVSDVKDKQDFGSIVVEPSDEISNFSEKAGSVTKYVSAGIYCFNKDVFEFMPEQESFSIETEFFPTIIGKRFFGFRTDHEFIDIGTPDRLKKAKNFLTEER